MKTKQTRIRIMAYVLTVIVLATTSATNASSLLADDFDDYATGSTPVPPWSELYPGWGGSPLYDRAGAAALGITIQVDDTTFIAGKSLHFVDTSEGIGSGVGSAFSRVFSAASSVVVEYYMRTGNDAYEGAFVRLTGDVGADYTLAFSNGAFDGSAGWIGVHGSPAGWVEPELLAYSEDTWYYARRELDCVSGTGLFYVEEVGNPSNNASYSIGHNYSNTYIDEIVISTSNSQGADCYIDELVVTPEPATLGLVVIGGLAMMRRRHIGTKAQSVASFRSR